MDQPITVGIPQAPALFSFDRSCLALEGGRLGHFCRNPDREQASFPVHQTKALSLLDPGNFGTSPVGNDRYRILPDFEYLAAGFGNQPGGGPFFDQHPLTAQELDAIPGKGQAQGTIAEIHYTVFPAGFVLDGPQPFCFVQAAAVEVIFSRTEQDLSLPVGEPQFSLVFHESAPGSHGEYRIVPVIDDDLAGPVDIAPFHPVPSQAQGCFWIVYTGVPQGGAQGCSDGTGPVEGTDFAPGLCQAVLEREDMIIGSGKKLFALGIDGHGPALAVFHKSDAFTESREHGLVDWGQDGLPGGILESPAPLFLEGIEPFKRGRVLGRLAVPGQVPRRFFVFPSHDRSVFASFQLFEMGCQ